MRRGHKNLFGGLSRDQDDLRTPSPTPLPAPLDPGCILDILCEYVKRNGRQKGMLGLGGGGGITLRQKMKHII